MTNLHPFQGNHPEQENEDPVHRLQLAFMYALCRSLPDYLTMRGDNPSKSAILLSTFLLITAAEYILRLRKCISPPCLTSGIRRLDPVVFWRNELSHARAANAALERENVLLREKIGDIGSLHPGSGGDGGCKRKRDREEANAARQAVKRRRGPGSGHNQTVDDGPTHASTLATPTEAETTALFSLFHIIELLREKSGDAEQLSRQIRYAAAATSEMIARLGQPTPTSTEENSSSTKLEPHREAADTDQEITAICKICSALVRGVSYLSGLGDESATGRAVYDVVRVFKSAIGAIASLTSNTWGMRDTDSSRGSRMGQGRYERHTSLAESATRISLTMLSSLEEKTESQRHLYEGFLHTLIERVSGLLAHCTFGWNYGSATGGEVDACDNAVPLDMPQADAAADRSSFAAETRHLVCLLEQALPLAPHLLELQEYKSTGDTRTLSVVGGEKAKTWGARKQQQRPAGKTILRLCTREKVQNTLVNGVFGEPMDEEKGFGVLKLPSRPPPMPSLPKTSNCEDPGVWFREQIWRLVGWEVLGSVND